MCEATTRTAAEDGSNRNIYADAVQEKISPGELSKISDHTEKKRLESHGSVASHNHTQHFEEVCSRWGVDFCSNEALEAQYLKAVC